MSQTSQTPPVNPAEAYEKALVQPVFRTLARHVMDITQPAPGDRVLDVATGTGICLREVADRVGNSCQLVGVDLNPAMVAVGRSIAEETGVSIEWHEGSAVELPFHDAAFDWVFCQHGLQFFPDRPAALRDMRRVLIDGGRAVIAVWKGLEHHPYTRSIDEAGLVHTGSHLLNTPGGPFSLGDPDELAKLIEQAGFRDVQVNEVSFKSRRDDPTSAMRMDVAGATAVLPALQKMESSERESLVNGIVSNLKPTLNQYVEDGSLINDWHANVAIAVK